MGKGRWCGVQTLGNDVIRHKVMCFSLFPGSHFRFARSLDRGRNRLSYFSGESPAAPILAKSDQIWKKSTCYWTRNTQALPLLPFSHPSIRAPSMQKWLNWHPSKKALRQSGTEKQKQQQRTISISSVQAVSQAPDSPPKWDLLISAQCLELPSSIRASRGLSWSHGSVYPAYQLVLVELWLDTRFIDAVFCKWKKLL